MSTKITRKTVREEISRLTSLGQFDEALNLVLRFKVKGFTITHSTIKRDYKLPNNLIENLSFRAVKNPHYSSAAPMKLYLTCQVQIAYQGYQNNQV